MKDKCEFCYGSVRDNENIVGELIMCDYCFVEWTEEKNNMTLEEFYSMKVDNGVTYSIEQS